MIRKIFLLVLAIFLTNSVIGQSWEDSLRAGKKYYEENQFEKAYRTLLEAQKLAPSNVDLSQDIGNAAYRNNDFEMAEKAFRSAATKNNDASHNAKNWHNVGNSQMKAKNYQAAVESYKQSLRKNPTNNETRYNLAEAQRRLRAQEQQQSQDQSKNGDDKDNQDQSSKSDQTNENNSDDQQNQGDDNQQHPGQGAGNPNEKTNQDPQSKLSDQKTDRMLEDLLKQEMKTKKKIQGIESSEGEQIKSGKRW